MQFKIYLLSQADLTHKLYPNNKIGLLWSIRPIID